MLCKFVLERYINRNTELYETKMLRERERGGNKREDGLEKENTTQRIVVSHILIVQLNQIFLI